MNKIWKHGHFLIYLWRREPFSEILNKLLNPNIFWKFKKNSALNKIGKSIHFLMWIFFWKMDHLFEIRTKFGKWIFLRNTNIFLNNFLRTWTIGTWTFFWKCKQIFKGEENFKFWPFFQFLNVYEKMWTQSENSEHYSENVINFRISDFFKKNWTEFEALIFLKKITNLNL